MWEAITFGWLVNTSYNPRHLLFSNGMQTLGVALPWAISAALVRPNTQVVSVAGDGGFYSQDKN